MHTMNKLALAGLLMYSVSLSSGKEETTSTNNNTSGVTKPTLGSTFNYTDSLTDNDTVDPTSTTSAYKVIGTNTTFGGKTGVYTIQTTHEDATLDTNYIKYEDNGDLSSYISDGMGSGSWATFPFGSHTATTADFGGGAIINLTYLGAGSVIVAGKTLATQRVKLSGTFSTQAGNVTYDGVAEFAPSIGNLTNGNFAYGGAHVSNSTRVLTSYSIK